MLSSFTRSERIIIVEDDRIRSVVIGPKQRLRPAFFIALAVSLLLLACLGWALTAAELLRTRQTAQFIEEGTRLMSAQLAESRSQVAALGGELETARETLATALEQEAEARARIEAVLAALDVPDAASNTAQTTRALRTAIAEARTGLAPLSTGEESGLTAAARSLETVEAASRALAERRAQAAIAAAEVAAAQADQEASGHPGLQAQGLALALVEAKAESARLRDEAEAARAERDRALTVAAETETRMAVLTEGQVELLARLTHQADRGIDELEGALKQTGLDLDSLLTQLDGKSFGQGGPLTLASLQTDLLPPAASQAFSELESRMDRQARLRALLHLLPLSAPAEDFYVSSGFGRRLDPFTNQRAMHTGIDLVGKFRSPIVAAAPGTVISAGYDSSGYGRLVEVDHGFGIVTRYAHLDKITVKKGDTVVHGQQIGTLGNSGRSSGPHLHYEILVGGKPVDPLRFMERGRHVCQG